MGAYLIDNEPARSQFRSRGDTKPTGLTVIHTAESVMDTITVDTGAENVAAFIQRRTEPGSYHDLADSDSVIQLVPYELAAFQDGTGSNDFALSISAACRTTDWVKMTAERRAAFLTQMARAFARQQAWLKANGYPLTPIGRVTKAQSDAGAAGFISHAERDPARRSDPGKDFPWTEWFQACARAVGPDQEDDMTPEQAAALTKTLESVDHLESMVSSLGRVAVAIHANTAQLVAAPDDLDEATLARLVLAGMPVEAIAAAIPTNLAEQVADELAARLAGGA